MYLLRNKFLNTSSMLFAMDGERSAADIERDEIQLESLQPENKDEKKDDKTADTEGDNKETDEDGGDEEADSEEEGEKEVEGEEA